MVFIIDGDNSPGSKTKDVGLLKEYDTLYVVYAANNNFYTKTENRERVEQRTRCKIHWLSVPEGKCAADIAIAMQLSCMLNNNDKELLCMISDDKHFELISCIAKKIYRDTFVVSETSITDAVSKYRILEQTTLQEMHDCFVNMFGRKQGGDFYNQLKSLILQEKKANKIIFKWRN